MKVQAIKKFSYKVHGEVRTIQPCMLLDIEDSKAQKLMEAGVAVPLSQAAWLEGDELRTRGHIPDLIGEIVQLTNGNLDLQRTLLLRHCEEYDNNHLWWLAEQWEERAAIMQHDGGMTREQAEFEAARYMNLLAFLDDLQHKTVLAS